MFFFSASLVAFVAFMASPAVAQSISDTQALADIESLCQQMSYMPGCSVRNLCLASGTSDTVKNQPYCKPVSILADICTLDMPKMSGCKTYTSLCTVNPTPTRIAKVTFAANSSALCTEYPPIPLIPDTKTVNDQIKSICTEMDMEGCSSCKINPEVSSSYLDCDQLRVYSDLCIAMPEMNQCGQWKDMCTANPNLPYCEANTSSPSYAPTMKMFFHTGYSEYVLFKEFVPQTQGQYILACLAMLVLAILYEGSICLETLLEVYWMNTNKAAACFPAKLSPEQCQVTPQPSNAAGTKATCCQTTPAQASSSTIYGFSVVLIRGAFKFVNATVGYALMLITMTFNVGLFFSVVGGLALGTMIFGGFSRRARLNTNVSVENPTGCC